MKTITKQSFVVFLMAMAAAFLSSCQDDDATPGKNDPSKKEKAAKVLAFREELNFVNRFVETNIPDPSSDEGRRASLATTTIARVKNIAPCADATEQELPDGTLKVTLDFGDGCETSEGVQVAGFVEIIFSFTENDFDFTLTFKAYKEVGGGNHEGELVNGTVSGSFLVDIMSEQFIQEMEQDLVISYADGNEAIYRVTQRAEMTEDGIRVVALTTSGSLADGGAFTTSLSKALVYDFACGGDFPVQGEELLNFQGNTIKVNYGSGHCDEEFTTI